MRERELQYREVFSASSDGMSIVDIDGVLVEANPAFYRMHGYSDGELEGTHVSNILAKLGLASRTQAALWAVREGIAPGHNGIISPR